MNVSAAKPVRAGRTLAKKVLFSGVILLVSYLVLEAVSLGLLLRRFPNLAFVFNKRAAAAHPPHQAPRPYAHIDDLHPYFGYVRRPVTSGDSSTVSPVSEWGFPDTGPPLRQRSSGKLIVAIMGGSVAEALALTAAPDLADELLREGRYSAQDVEFVRLAMQGYKQPQQLMTLAYLLTLGGEFDVVVNLDGFNELALSIGENYEHAVFPSFPRMWHVRVATADSLEAARARGQAVYLEQRRHDMAKWFARPPWSWSLTATLIWTCGDAQLEDRVQQSMRHYQVLMGGTLPPHATGPPHTFERDEDLYRHCVDVWRQSSLLMHQMCRAHGIAYYHFLQPNQYVPASKPMGRAERHIALRDPHPYRVPIEIGYPLLRRAGGELVKLGVNFHDLTQVFADHAELLYIDDCCHLNDEGYRILARKIGELVRLGTDGIPSAPDADP